MIRDIRTPKWQDLSGLDPELEDSMSRDERRDAIRTLVTEVERLARVEFQFAQEHPDPERTFMWDPLDYICNVLEISRVKLSRYTVELTGKRAHQINDAMKAISLPDALRGRLETHFAAMRPILESMYPFRAEPDSEQFKRCEKWVLKVVRDERSGASSVRWAIELGYANASRLKKACEFAHGFSVAELEQRIVRQLVQKFFESQPLQAVEAGQSSTEVGQTFLSAQKQAKPPLIPPPLEGGGKGEGSPASAESHGAKVFDSELECLKTELGLAGELSDDDREILEAILAERRNDKAA